MNFDMSEFDSYREDNRREVKKAKGGLPVSLWETYSAFANCYGGVILLGVKENKDGSWYMTGLDNPAKLRKDFWDTMNNKNKVSVNLLTDNDVEIYEENNSVIMVIHVPKAKREQKPVYINGDMFNGTFRRNWEGDYHCDRSQVLAMLRDQPEETADMKILQDMPLEVLNSETVRAYRNRHMAYRTEHVWERLSDEEYLERIGAAKLSAGDQHCILRLPDSLCLEMNIKFYMNSPSIFWIIVKSLIRQSAGRTDCSPVRATGREIYLISFSAFMGNL